MIFWLLTSPLWQAHGIALCCFQCMEAMRCRGDPVERLVSLREAQDRFFEDLLLEGRSHTTLKTYRSFLRSLYTDDPLLSLTSERCRSLIGERLRTQAYATAKTYAGVLSSFGTFLALVYGVQNPMTGVPTPRPKPRPHRFLSKAEIMRLWKACPDDSYRLLLLLLLEGLRASEATGLRWRDLNGDTALIRGKGEKYRRIVLSVQLRAYLDAVPQTSTYVLGYGYMSLRQRVQRLGRLANIPNMHAHLLRHSWASLSLIEGLDSETLRSLGGWSATSKSIQKYIESAREQASLARAREFQIVNRLLSGE